MTDDVTNSPFTIPSLVYSWKVYSAPGVSYTKYASLVPSATSLGDGGKPLLGEYSKRYWTPVPAEPHDKLRKVARRKLTVKEAAREKHKKINS